MSDAAIQLVAYDPKWPAAFEEERQALFALLQPWLVGEIEHVGSTAVPGLAAKPIIDVMAPVLSLESSSAAMSAAKSAGYVYFPYKPELMHWFCKPAPEFRTHHLHLVPRGSRLWAERLAFRDALRQDSALCTAYSELKYRLARQFEHDREAYTEAKTPFILAALQTGQGSGSAA